MSLLTSMGEGAAAGTGIAPGVGSIIGAGIGLIGGLLGQHSQEEANKEAQQTQFEQSKQLANISEQEQMKLWTDTNYPAQVKMMQAAGLNPALMYKGSGPGGSTGSGAVPIPTMAPVVDKTKAMASATELAETAANVALMQSQAKKNDADANLSNVQAAKAAGVDTDLGNQNIGESKSRQNLNEFDLGMKKTLQDLTIQRTEAETQQAQTEQQKTNADWQAYKQASFGDYTFDNPNTPLARQIKAQIDTTVLGVEKAKKENNLLDGQKAIQDFEIKLNDIGLTKHDPEWERILGSLMTKLGLNPLK